MTFSEAIATQPAWIGVWLNVLLAGAFVLPLALLIWRQSRLIGIVVPLSSLAGGLATNLLYDQMGYVKLLGLPHILIWTPVAIYLMGQIRRDDMPAWPRRIMSLVLATIGISLVFDYSDLVRYILGERTPLVLAPGLGE